MKENSLPKMLRDLRKVHSYTQDYVASALGVVRQTYSHYETGKRSPSPEILYKLAALYHVSVDDLMQQTVELDPEMYYETPSHDSATDYELRDYLRYYDNPYNQKKFRYFNNLEKELIYYFSKLSDEDKKELIEIAKIKAKKQKKD